MNTSAQQIRAYTGWALFGYGFRPFFLFGGIWSVVSVMLWLPLLAGDLSLPMAFSPVEWHSHELIFGFVPSVAAGFLLTAVPNWTGRLPVVGAPLACLFGLWLLGRLAIALSALLPPTASALIDLLFLIALDAVLAREVIAGKNWRNLKVLAVVAAMLIGNAVFHWEHLYETGSGYGIRLGLAAVLLLIMLIAGRIIPSFTRNWLMRRPPGRLPIPFDRSDTAIVLTGGLALLAWVLCPDSRVTATLSVLAGLANAWRLARWAGDRTPQEPLVLVLHVAFAFVPAGFFLVALAVLDPSLITATGALHAWTTGAIGSMTLAVMTRASLGHGGRPLTATPATQFIYVAVFAAALARLIAAFDVWRGPMLHVSAIAWVGAFACFVIIYWPILLHQQHGTRQQPSKRA